MMGKSDILRLSISERIQLVQDIWDSIAEVPDSVLLTDEQKAELDRRLDAYHKAPKVVRLGLWCVRDSRAEYEARAYPPSGSGS